MRGDDEVLPLEDMIAIEADRRGTVAERREWHSHGLAGTSPRSSSKRGETERGLRSSSGAGW